MREMEQLGVMKKQLEKLGQREAGSAIGAGKVRTQGPGYGGRRHARQDRGAWAGWVAGGEMMRGSFWRGAKNVGNGPDWGRSRDVDRGRGHDHVSNGLAKNLLK